MSCQIVDRSVSSASGVSQHVISLPALVDQTATDVAPACRLGEDFGALVRAQPLTLGPRSLSVVTKSPSSHLIGGAIVVGVAGGVIRIQEQMSHRRRARRLNP